MNKDVVLSGMQPSGDLTFGHLSGAFLSWQYLQQDYYALFCVVDQHAITVPQNPKLLRSRTLDLAAMYLAADIHEDSIFIQSHVPAHVELAWVLTTLTGMGECSRMTQFKDKSARSSDSATVGLFTYPILMAADILLYQAAIVPVGDDQKQHVELARNLAERFNHRYGETFTIPEPLIPKIGGRVMSLQDPTTKMSKSDPNLKATIFLKDDDKTIVSKIKRAVTDSGSIVPNSLDDYSIGLRNLLYLRWASMDRDLHLLVGESAGKQYGEFKQQVAEDVVEKVRPIRERYLSYRADEVRLCQVLRQGADKARGLAAQTLSSVYEKIGFLAK